MAVSDLVRQFGPVADGLAALLHPHVEVVIHDLATQTVAYIANNLSRRALGDESALQQLAGDPGENVIGPYGKINWNGARMRCISIVARDAGGTAIGLICANMDLSVLESAHAALALLIDRSAMQPQPENLFRDDWQERINTFLQDWLRQHGATLAALNRGEKRALVQALYAHGAFRGKSTAAYVGNLLGISRATIFTILKPLRAV
jgi:D-arginine utilization repressor